MAVPYQGTGQELGVLAAVLIGGVTLKGGSGSIFNVIVGVLFMGVLINGLAMLNVDSTLQIVVQGIAILAAVSLYSQTRN
jgi:ribose transport system permease protein